MKKCCLPKRICMCYHDKSTCCRSNNTRNTVASKSRWASRNDSSNISAILQPDCYKSDSDSDSEDFLHFCSAGVTRKVCLGDNNCYCNEKPLAPSLLRRPRTCIVLDDPKPKPRIKVASGSICFKADPCDGKKLQAPSERPKKLQAPSERLEKLKKKLRDQQSEPPCLRYTRLRENYEHLRDIFQEDDLQRVREYEDDPGSQEARRKSSGVISSEAEEPRRDSKSGSGYEITEENRVASDGEAMKNGRRPSKNGRRSSLKNGNNFVSTDEHQDQDRRESRDSVQAERLYVASNFTENTSQKEDTSGGAVRSSVERSQVDSSQASPEGTRNSLDANLIQFRKDHYAETHSVPDRSVPEHDCVHKFELDDRLFPMPLNGDAYGTSRCIICDKLMPIEKTVFKDGRLDKKTFPQYYKYGLKPRRVNIGAENTKIVLTLTEKNARLLKDLPFAFTKPQYTNTHALRFQKGAY